MTGQLATQEIPLRDVLRARTRDIHERLHLHPSFAALFDGTLDSAGYRHLMRRLYGFYAPLDRAIEDALKQIPQVASGYRHASRSDLLSQDITDLTTGKETDDPPSLSDEAFGFVSPASVGGVLYVIEGATLGGARIDRAARLLLGSDRPHGRRYWAWCRSESGRRWPAALTQLDRFQAAGMTPADLGKGAAETFGLLEDWLAPLGQARHDPETRQPGQ